jgi:hypothetical protein
MPFPIPLDDLAGERQAQQRVGQVRELLGEIGWRFTQAG